MESSSSSKRAKAPGNVAPHCLVDGCSADLSQCRDYHRRHKVCEAHSKTPKVTIAGREQRFCQQCSRFHSLVEFDEGKRSCRKRLDGHNRRRRKPQPEQATTSRLVSFSTPQILGSSSSSYPWAGVNYMDTGGFVDPAATSSSGSDGALSLLSSREFGLPQAKQLPLHLPLPLPLPLVNNATIGAGQYHHHHHHQSNDAAAFQYFPQEETSSPHHTLSFMWE